MDVFVLRPMVISILLALLYGQAVPRESGPIEARGPYDHRHVTFERDLDRVFVRAKEENKLVFFKPIYGGVDAEGAKDYREGCW